MTTRVHPTKVGRKSKGQRHVFVSRIPQDRADRVIAECESRDMAYSDWIAEVVALAMEEGLHERVSKPRVRDVSPQPQQGAMFEVASGM